ncbi:MAG: hypothetical protein Q9174_007113 [Haloplaca sp. 1 TL-2023]
MGAIQFIEGLDRTSLTISDEDFEKNVEASVSEIAERHEEESEQMMPPPAPPPPPRPPHISEKSGLSEPEMIPRNSMEGEYNTPSRPLSSRGSTDRRPGTDGSDDSNAVTGLLRTIQRPLSSIGRMFSDDGPGGQYPGSRGQTEALAPTPAPTPIRLSPSVFQPPRKSNEEVRSPPANQASHPQQISAEDAAARQASAEAAEAHRIQRIEHKDVVDTLAGMFPDLDRDIIDDVVREKQGRMYHHGFFYLIMIVFLLSCVLPPGFFCFPLAVGDRLTHLHQRAASSTASLPGWAIGVIILAGVLLVACAAFAVATWLRRRRERRERENREAADERIRQRQQQYVPSHPNSINPA